MARTALRNKVRSALFSGVACAVAIGAGGCGSDSEAQNEASSCVAPVLEVTPSTVAVGEAVTIHGRYYLNGCDDVVVDGVPAQTSTPLIGVPLVMTTGTGTDQEVVKLDAVGGLGEIEYSMTTPPSVGPGTVTFALGEAAPVAVTVTP